MLFDKSFYPKCPGNPKSTHIFCMGGHSGKRVTKFGSISVTTTKPKSLISLTFLRVLANTQNTFP